MTKYADRVAVTVEPAKDDSGNWYWSVEIEGELYADGEEASKQLASHKAMLNLDEWKARIC